MIGEQGRSVHWFVLFDGEGLESRVTTITTVIATDGVSSLHDANLKP